MDGLTAHYHKIVIKNYSKTYQSKSYIIHGVYLLIKCNNLMDKIVTATLLCTGNYFNLPINS